LTLPLITWKESYSVGIPTIDAQHKQLVALINALHDGMRNGLGNEMLSGVFDSLIKYTETHFKDEERMLAVRGYPTLLAHKAQHADFVTDARKLAADFKAGRVALSMPVMSFLKTWLTTHILDSDQQYAAYLRQPKPVSVSR
jgi:hemerythrin-like metal-binding protein